MRTRLLKKTDKSIIPSASSRLLRIVCISSCTLHVTSILENGAVTSLWVLKSIALFLLSNCLPVASWSTNCIIFYERKVYLVTYGKLPQKVKLHIVMPSLHLHSLHSVHSKHMSTGLQVFDIFFKIICHCFKR